MCVCYVGTVTYADMVSFLGDAYYGTGCEELIDVVFIVQAREMLHC